MTPQQVEAKLVLLVYCSFAFFAVAVLTFVFFMWEDRKRKEEQFRRRDHIMDQAALRIKEVSLFIEQLWQNKANH